MSFLSVLWGACSHSPSAQRVASFPRATCLLSRSVDRHGDAGSFSGFTFFQADLGERGDSSEEHGCSSGSQGPLGWSRPLGSPHADREAVGGSGWRRGLPHGCQGNPSLATSCGSVQADVHIWIFLVLCGC